MDMALDQRPPTGGGGPPPQQVNDWMDINAFLRLLWRRKKLCFTTICVCTAIAASYAFFAAPKYEAYTQLLFEADTSLVGDTASARDRELQDEAGILSQIEVLQSRELALRVIDELQLYAVDELNPTADGGIDGFFPLKSRLPWIFGNDSRGKQTSDLDEQRIWPPPPPQPKRPAKISQVVDRFLSRLEVMPAGRSRVVELTFTAEDPELPARVANFLVELYLVMRFEHRLQYARQASDWLAMHAQQMKADVEHTERALEDYRRAHNLFQGDRMMLLTQQVSDLSRELMAAAHDRAATEAELEQARRVANVGDIAALSQVLDSSLIQKLREEEVNLERVDAEMNERYGPLHPEMVELKAAKRTFLEKTSSEVSKIIRNLEGRVQVAQRREEDLQRDLEALKEQVAQANTASVHLRTLERDAEASRLLLERFMTSFMEVSAQQDVQSQIPQASVISKATAPQRPSFPRKKLIVLIGFIGGAILSVPLAFAADALGSGYRSAQEVELDIGLPVLAHVLKVRRQEIEDKELVDHVISKPDSAFTESIRLLCSRFLTSPSHHLHESVVFISAEAGEGKTTIVLSLARALAKAGRRILVLDADFRRGKVARVLHLRRELGLSELIAGAAKLEDVIQHDVRSAVDVIVSGAYASESADDLSGEFFSSILQDLTDRYDLVLIDAPPFLALSSASILAAKTDAAIIVATWNATTREVVRYTASEIQKLSPRLAGIVLSKVDMKKNSQYDHGDSQLFGSDACKYYVA